MTKALVQRIQKRLPSGLRKAMARAAFVRAAARRIDPFRDPGHIWTLTGPLDGARFKVAEPSERQYITGPYEPAVVEALKSAVRPGMTCVDAGAHIGYMTLILVRAAGPNGRVIAFEPSESNCDRLRENLALNSVENATVVQAFVSAGEGRAHLADGPSSFEHHLDVAGGELETAPSVALDGYFADRRVDFVKLDVEGADELAVEGMRRILAEDRPTVLLEDHGAPTIAAKAILASLGYAFSEVDQAHALALPG
jgi:FkbM family methyltransferase